MAELLELSANIIDDNDRSKVDRHNPTDARVHELLADVPDTLLHGDFHLDNVLFPPTGPVILDWARVARGPAFLELADVALTGHPSAIADVFATYLAALRESGVDISEDGAIRAFTGALFRRLVVGTYGLAAWPAPSDREQRLLRDAVTRTQAAFLAWLHGRGRGIR